MVTRDLIYDASQVLQLQSYQSPYDSETPSFLNSFTDGVGPQAIGSGGMEGQVTIQSGYIQSSNFVSGSAGWQLTPTSAELNVSTALASLDIPDTTTANSFHVESDGDTYWGANVATGFAAAPASIGKDGAATFSSITITGGDISGTPISSIPNDTSTDISLLGATATMVFSVTDADTVAWSSGTITLSNGRTFSIDAGNTGNMAALTYIYLDPAVSSTVLQTTTTAATAQGADKLVIGVAENQTTTASYIPYVSGGQPLLDGEQIGALSIKAAQIGALAVTTAKIDDLAVTNAKINDLAVSKLTAGTITSKSINMAVTPGGGDVEIRAGIAAGDFANTGVNAGFILGIDDSDSDKEKFYIGDGTEYIYWDGTNLTIEGGITVDQIDIGGDDATSTHIDTAGNQHWGAAAANFSTAPARISNAGDATFESIQVGGSTRQYTMGDNGIGTFGDGEDGSETLDGVATVSWASLSSNTYTMSRDCHMINLTINSGITLKPNGYRIYGLGTLTVNGKIDGEGNIGTNGEPGENFGTATAGGDAGAALADGYLNGNVGTSTGTGGDGGTASQNGSGNTAGSNGSAGTAATQSIGSAGVAGGNGGTGGNGGGTGSGGGTGGSGGALTSTPNVKIYPGFHLNAMLDVNSDGTLTKYKNGAQGGGGAGGGGGDSTGTNGQGGGGGHGGGAGSNGRILFIAFKDITVSGSGNNNLWGTNYAGSATWDTAVGAINWNNQSGPYKAIGNLTAGGDSYANSCSMAISTPSYYIKNQDYRFNLPSTATIKGIKYEGLVRSGTGGTAVSAENSIRLYKNDTLTGDDKSTSSTISSTYSWRSYGGTTDLWNATWTYSDINAATFGTAWSAAKYASNGINYYKISRVSIYIEEGIITSAGGNGAPGSSGGPGGCNTGTESGSGGGGGGGGAGGNGGDIILVYNTYTNNGIVTAQGGKGGKGGTSTPEQTSTCSVYDLGSAGSDGTDGTAGTIRQFNLSM